MSGPSTTFPKRGAGGLLVNLAVLIGALALVNALAAGMIGRPAIYCMIAGSQIAQEALGFVHLALLVLAPLGVIALLRGDKSGLNLLGLAVLIALLPTFFETLFNVAPGCAPATFTKGISYV